MNDPTHKLVLGSWPLPKQVGVVTNVLTQYGGRRGVALANNLSKDIAGNPLDDLCPPEGLRQDVGNYEAYLVRAVHLLVGTIVEISCLGRDIADILDTQGVNKASMEKRAFETFKVTAHHRQRSRAGGSFR